MALPLATVIVGGQKEGSTTAEVVTTAEGSDEPRKTSFSTQGLAFDPKESPHWVNYVKGVVAHFKPCPVPGFRAAIVTSVPIITIIISALLFTPSLFLLGAIGWRSFIVSFLGSGYL